MSDEYWEIDYLPPAREVVGLGHDGTPYFDYSPPARAGRYDPIADHGRERPGYRVRWIPGTTDYEWVPVEPLYRIVYATDLGHFGWPLTWPELIDHLRKMSPGAVRSVVRRVERSPWP